MPIPVTTPPTSLDQCSISTSDAIVKLIQIILRARLGTHYECAQDHQHDHTACCFHLKHCHLQRIRGSFSVIINILQQNKTSTTTSGTLLERWIISLDPSSTTTPDTNMNHEFEAKSDNNNNAATTSTTTTPTTTSTTTDETDAILLLQAVYSHTRLMPLHTLLSNNNLKKSDLAAMITMDNSSRSRCHSKHASFSTSTITTDATTMNPDDFPHTAHIKTYQFFPRSHLRLQVVYQDNLVDEASVSCGVAMRRLSRLSLSAIEDDTDMHEHPNNNNNNNTYHHHNPIHHHNHTSQYHQQLQQQQHFNPLLQPLRQSSPPNNNDPYYPSNTIVPHDNNHSHHPHHHNINNNNNNNKTTLSASIPIPNMQYTHHHGLVAYSTSPSPSFGATRAPWATSIPSSTSHQHHPFQQRRTSWTGDHPGGSLVGSYEESLLSGRMSATPSKPIFFQAQIGVLGKECKASLRCPPHRSVTFPAFFYDMQEQLVPPYVGTVDLVPPYRLPPKGQLQIVIKNPNKTAVKLFLIPYDVSDMPKNTKTFLRQKSYDGHSLRYAVQVQLCRTDKKRVYLYKHIRVVFANRISDSREKLKVTCEGPQERGPLTKADLDLLSAL
ncbi:hypothetical protein BDA99DRAFT_516939 [Phascolomyces articulosus]|uniref:Autophagy-related protein 13 n=1 Tax=Phascolomyces articulosus TaxID=60185 RepID=A0AAD5JVQ6_9FUNG|nr:hypothetical protein BDA99DRAFT_516939 [Phascolomyces articulosus]